MTKKMFDVSGMTCAACQSHVEKAVRKVSGVKEVNVNLLMNNMSVEYDENSCSVDVIISAVEAAGYFAKEQGTNVKSADNQPIGKDINKSNALKKLIFCFVCLLCLMYFSMGNMMWGFPAPDFLDHEKNPLGYALIQFLLLLPVLFVYRNYFISGFKKLFKGAPNMDTLIAIGSSVSLLYGIVALFIMSYYQSLLAFSVCTKEQISLYKSIIAQYHDNLYFESAGMILTLVSLGKYLEKLSEKKTTKAIESLIKLAPEQATVIRNGLEQKILAKDVVIGDLLIVKKGECIAVDGVVESGECSVDESNITGESLPVQKQNGDLLYSSTTVTAGYVKMRATKVGEDTAFASIIKLVNEAANSKAPVSKLADKISGIFVPVILGISLLTLIGNLLYGATIETALNFAVTVVVIACPCALGLATPVAIMAGTGKGAQCGLIIKNAEILEKLHSVNTVVFDKTGTLTEGKPQITDFCATDKTQSTQLISQIYSIENMSEHPLAYAFCSFAQGKGAMLLDVSCYDSQKGQGICGNVQGDIIKIGNAQYVFGQEGMPKNVKEQADNFALLGKTVLFVQKNGEYAAIIGIKDELKPDAKSVVAELKKRKINTVMLTGDNQATAQSIAKEVGVTQVIAQVLPAEKQHEIEKLKQGGAVVAMAGDGVNDAPALMSADIGIAMGGGSDAALNSGDIILLKNSLAGIVNAVDLSKKVLTTIKIGLFWAFFYNMICVFAATGIPYYAWGIKLTPMFGALAMSFSSVSVVLNALTINLFKPKQFASDLPQKQGIESDKKENNINGANASKENNYMTTVLKVDGMMCMHCVKHVESAAKKVQGVIDAKADLDAKQVTVEHNGADISLVIKNITDEGYTVSE